MGKDAGGCISEQECVGFLFSEVELKLEAPFNSCLHFQKRGACAIILLLSFLVSPAPFPLL